MTQVSGFYIAGHLTVPVFLYSNIGAAMLGFLVESVSGKDFNSYCLEHGDSALECFFFAYDEGFLLSECCRGARWKKDYFFFCLRAALNRILNPLGNTLSSRMAAQRLSCL